VFKITLKLIVLIGIAAGLYGAAIVSFETISQEKICPKVLGIHACYIVFIGYLWMLITVLWPAKKITFFLIGWMPVFLLALSASVLELMYSNICPQSKAGIPLCFLSLGLSVSVLTAFIFYRKDKVRV
jgi:hypothetical protein